MLRKRRPVDACLCVRMRQPSRCATQAKEFQLPISKRSSSPSLPPKRKATASASPWPIESSLNTAAPSQLLTRVIVGQSSPYNFQSRKDNIEKNKSGRGACPRTSRSGGKPLFLTCSSYDFLLTVNS